MLGDPLDIIASGPTVDDPATAADALAVLEQFHAAQAGIAPAVFEYLRSRTGEQARSSGCPTTNFVIGNNATAVETATREAHSLGYRPRVLPTDTHEGFAEDVGRRLAELTLEMIAAAQTTSATRIA